MWFDDVNINDVPKVGGKNASLGEMIRSIRKEGIRIPNGFATTAKLYWDLVDKNGLRVKIESLLQDLIKEKNR